MTKQEFWALFYDPQEEEISLAEEMNRTSFDELLEIDLETGRYRIIYHVPEKYLGTSLEGDFRRFYLFALEHFVHPEDHDAYSAMVDPDFLAERLKKASNRGILKGLFRLKGSDESWIWTMHLLISGTELGLPEHIIRCYVYDIQRQKERVHGEIPESEESSHTKHEDVTGLLLGQDYFRLVDSKLPLLTDGWCIIDIDIEHFKLFVDWYGMESGRYLLSQIGGILREESKANGGLPGYLGSEHFCLVTPCNMEQIRSLHEKIHSLISTLSMIEGFSPIFGIARIDGSASHILEYYNHAGLKTEEIKGNLHKRIDLYDAGLHRKNAEEYQLLYAFQNALDNGEIGFYLQPQYRVSNRKIVGAESLARWWKKDGSMISPAVFVPILEKHGIITRLDIFIWEAVCQWIRQWMDQGHPIIPVSVNVSQIDILSLDVPEHFASLLKKYELPVESIKVEITESAYVDNGLFVQEAVSKLRKMGFMVLMDDFGSGYSSLNMLRSLDVDLIKLDAQFLKISENEEHKGISILESIINMTQNLATPIIVEGVETEVQARFLSDLGCRYMQGFLFNRPMPVEEFEQIARDPSHIDTHGFVFKANQQFHTREFLDENIYSDAMLNNILGPVAFYNVTGESQKNIDIIRFNEQFYQLVGLEVEDFEKRRFHIQDYIYPEDLPKLYELFQYATLYRNVGAKGIIRVYRPSGMLVWWSLQIYFINEDIQGQKFYGSAQDVTELQFIHSDLPGAYYRCTLEDEFEFLFISNNFQRITGFSENEIKILFDNRLLRMVHPMDAPRLIEESQELLRGNLNRLRPYRIQRKCGDYIYMAEQTQLTDRYGELCWQCIAIDVTDVMHVRNQMRILSAHLKDTILFLHRTTEGLIYEVAIHGLTEALGLDTQALQIALNSGIFCTWVEGYQNIPHQEYTERFIRQIAGSQKELNLTLPDGRKTTLVVRADLVGGERGDIEYIVVIRLHE